MAIQNRRGAYQDFKPEKLLEGEWATVTSGDPKASDGRGTYICYGGGVVKRMATYEDMMDYIHEATSDVKNQFANEMQESAQEILSSAIETIKGEVLGAITATINDNVYPIGSIYMNFANVNPEALFGGKWEKIEDRFLLAAGSEFSISSMGGEKEHTLTVDEMPSHNHTQAGHSHSMGDLWSTGSGSDEAYTMSRKRKTKIRNTSTRQPEISTVGGGDPHNNMPPYIAVGIWRRVA